MYKKIISIVCVAFVALINLSCFAYSDINDRTLKNAVDTLSEYSVINGYDDGTFRPNNNITRAEFSKIIISNMNLYMPIDNVRKFNDVSGHWAKDYIDIAKYLGVVNGVTDDLFCPDNNVTYEQAIKMIIVALGYDSEAVKNGGYPNGYIAVAKELGITDGIQYSKSEYATRRNISLMLFNCLDAPYYSIWVENGTLKREKMDITLRQLHEEILKFKSSDDYEDMPSEVG